MTTADRILLALAQAPQHTRTFEQLADALDMQGDQRPVLQGELRKLLHISEVTRIGLDGWALPARGVER